MRKLLNMSIIFVLFVFASVVFVSNEHMVYAEGSVQKDEFLKMVEEQWKPLLNPGSQNTKVAPAKETKLTPKKVEPVDSTVRYVALTFDDGPSSKTTGKLLDALKEKKIPATFFVLGKSLSNTTQFELAKRAFNEGHHIASHSWDHSDFTTLSDKQIVAQIQDTDVYIKKITGSNAIFFRPPYGAYNKNVISCVNKAFAMWSIDPRDWEPAKTKDTIVSKILGDLDKSKAKTEIILLHDIHGKSVDAAIELMELLPKKGYKFVSLPELLKISGKTATAGEIYTR